MNKVADTLIYCSWGTNIFAAITILDWGNLIFLILGCISLLISIVCSTISLIMKIKIMLKDGKIDAEEAKEIVEDLQNINKQVEEAQDKLKK